MEQEISNKNYISKSKYAYVTFIIINDSFLPGALMFAYGLRQQKTAASIVCLVSGKVSPQCVEALHAIFDKVINTDEVYVHHRMGHERQDRPFLFSRFNALRLGKDGDLRQGYKKIVVCDADLMPIKDYDSLFSLDVPAGIINEKKQNCVQSKDRKYTVEDAQSGKWCWHRNYGSICPHGQKIPMHITNRVKSDYENMGVNSSLWVLEPSIVEYEMIMDEIAKPETRDMISKFKWPEMQYATLRWSGLWTSVDIKYSSFNGYPNIESLCGTHYAGTKPWRYKDKKQLKHFFSYPDYYMWYMKYIQMMCEYNALFQCRKLSALYKDIVDIFENLA
ncbi:MAG: hypothetical protein AB1Z23_12345 [Eubacteriales bacterium]